VQRDLWPPRQARPLTAAGVRPRRQARGHQLQGKSDGDQKYKEHQLKVTRRTRSHVEKNAIVQEARSVRPLLVRLEAWVVTHPRPLGVETLVDVAQCHQPDHAAAPAMAARGQRERLHSHRHHRHLVVAAELVMDTQRMREPGGAALLAAQMRMPANPMPMSVGLTLRRCIASISPKWRAWCESTPSWGSADRSMAWSRRRIPQQRVLGLPVAHLLVRRLCAWAYPHGQHRSGAQESDSKRRRVGSPKPILQDREPRVLC